MKSRILLLAAVLSLVVLGWPALASEPRGGSGPVLAEDGRMHGLGAVSEPGGGMPSRFLPAVMGRDESVPLPESVDNSAYLPPVGDQGEQGSCVAFAFGYYCKTYAEVKEHGWSQFDLSHQYSPAYIYNQAQLWEDQGMYFADAMTLMQQLGCCSWTQMPYDDNNWRDWPFEAAYKEALKYRVGNAYALDTTLGSSLDSIKAHLASGRIGVLGLYVYQNFQYIGSFNNTYCMAQVSGGNQGGHAVAVVGYDDAMATADGVGAFRCVNSWGTNWGASGFFWLSYQAVTDLTHRITQGYFMYFDELPNDSPLYAAKFQISDSRFRSLGLSVGTGSAASPTTSAPLFDFLSYEDDRSPSISAPNWPMWVDLTPIFPIPQGTNVFLAGRNLDPNKPTNGQFQAYTLYRLSDMTSLNYTSVPVTIPFSGSLASANLAWPWATLAVTASATPTSGTAPLAVAFTGSATTGTPPYTFNWAFGDGATSTQQNPSHTYASVGTYTVSLMAQDTGGRTGYAAPLTITVSLLPPPFVSTMQKKGNPFRIVVNGGNLQSGIQVSINGTPWPNVVRNGPTQITLKGGGALKALVPKNTPTQFLFVNPDGGSFSNVWQWP